MKIVNQTNWNTHDLKKLINRTIQEVGATNNRTIKIVNNRRIASYMSGRATINGSWVKMRVPIQEFDPKLFASVLTHELHHNLGLKQKEMAELPSCYWASEYQVKKKEAKIEIVVPLLDKRYDHAKKMLNEKQSQMKRLATLTKKWNRKVTYYEKKVGVG